MTATWDGAGSAGLACLESTSGDTGDALGNAVLELDLFANPRITVEDSSSKIALLTRVTLGAGTVDLEYGDFINTVDCSVLESIELELTGPKVYDVIIGGAVNGSHGSGTCNCDGIDSALKIGGRLTPSRMRVRGVSGTTRRRRVACDSHSVYRGFIKSGSEISSAQSFVPISGTILVLSTLSRRSSSISAANE